MTRLLLQLNRAGSGEVTINQNDPAAADIAFGKFVRIVYRGEDRGGIFVDNINQESVSDGEEGERDIKVSGRGMLGIMDTMIVYWVNQGEATVYYTSKKIGFILDELLTLAQARGSYPNLIWDFSATHDSDGNAWTVNQDLSFRVGSTLLDAVEQFVELGVDFTMSFNPGADQYVLSAFKDGLGTDVSTRVVFQPAQSIKKASKLQEASGLRNAQLIEVADLTAGPRFVEATNAPSIATYGRREYFYQAGNAATVVQGVELALADLDKLKDPRVQYSLVVSDASFPTVFEDYNIGDTVGYLNDEGTIDLVKVISLQLDFSKDEYYAEVTIGLGVAIIDTEISSAQKIKKLGPGLTGGSGGGPSDPAVVAGALIGEHDADVTSHFPYLRNANKIQDELIIDPPVAPIDNDLLQFVAVNNRWEYVQPAALSLDHGNLSGLGDDDHTQYLLADGTRALAGPWDMGSQALTNVNIDSGVITGITDLAVADGGTGASNAADARTNLGLVAGGAGDIWVEKAGDIMVGNLTLSLNTPSLLFADSAVGASPLGRFLIQSNSDFFHIRGRNAGDTDYESIMTMERIADGGRVNIGTGAGERKLTVSGTGEIKAGPGSMVTADDRGLYFHTTADWSIRRTNGAWGAPDFQQIIIDSITGIILNPGTAFGRSFVDVQGAMIIDGAADAIQFIVQGNATQTSNLVELQDSSGNVDISFLAGGAIFNAQLNDVDHIIGGDTEANLLVVDGGLDAVHIGDWDTNYFVTDLNGDTWWVGGGGLIVGHMYIPGVDITVDITDANPTEVFDDGTVSVGDGWAAGELNLVTFPGGGTEHYLTVPKAGKYKVEWDISFQMGAPGANVEVHGGIMVDDVAIRDKGEGHRTIANNTDTGSMTGRTIVDCPNGTEEISLWVLNADNNNDITVEHGNVYIQLIGGT